MWRVDSSHSGLYVHVGSMQVQGALCIRGEWQANSLVTVQMPAWGSASHLDRWGVIAAALQSFVREMKPVLSEREDDLRLMHVVLAHEWIEHARLPWSSEFSKGVDEASIRAAVHAQSRLSDMRDTIRVDATGWQEARWAVVYQQPLLELVQSAAQTLHLDCITVLPEAAVVSSAITSKKNERSVFGYVADQSLRMIEVHDGRVMSVLQRPVVGQSLDDAAQVWQAVCLRSPHWQGQKLDLLVDDISNTNSKNDVLRTLPWPQASQKTVPSMLRSLLATDSANHALNAVEAPTHGKLGWLKLSLMLMGILMLSLGGKWWHGHEYLAQLRQSTASTQQTSSSIKEVNTLSKQQLEQLRASNAVIRQLNLPVSQLLKAIEAPKDIRVALLGVDLNDVGSENSLPKLKINAEALTGEDAARYVAFLSDRKPFVSAYMLRHEIQQNTQERAWRFAVELTWQP